MPTPRNTFSEEVMRELGKITAEIVHLKESTDGLQVKIESEGKTRSDEIEKSFVEIRQKTEVLTQRVSALENLKQQLIGAAAGVGFLVSAFIGLGKYVLEHLWPK